VTQRPASAVLQLPHYQGRLPTEMMAIIAGVDVPALCSRFGIEVGNTGERVGTFAIAYAAHKALSPVWHICIICTTSMCLHHWGVCPSIPWTPDAGSDLLPPFSMQVRFPPTVALTPVVARILGKEGGDKEQPKA
jgi:hypothetical protein